MSKWLGSRKANQCKLYHHKMKYYYQSVGTIIQQLTHSLPQFAETKEEYEWESIDEKIEESQVSEVKLAVGEEMKIEACS